MLCRSVSRSSVTNSKTAPAAAGAAVCFTLLGVLLRALAESRIGVGVSPAKRATVLSQAGSHRIRVIHHFAHNLIPVQVSHLTRGQVAFAFMVRLTAHGRRPSQTGSGLMHGSEVPGVLKVHPEARDEVGWGIVMILRARLFESIGRG
jgi:hypothetical protein